MTEAILPEDSELIAGVMKEEGLACISDETDLIQALSDDLRRENVPFAALRRAVEEAVYSDQLSTIDIFTNELHYRLTEVSPIYTMEMVRGSVEQFLPGFLCSTDDDGYEDDGPEELDFS